MKGKDYTTRKQRLQTKEDKQLNIAYATLLVITVVAIIAQIIYFTPMQIK